MPAQAGIQSHRLLLPVAGSVDSRLRGSDKRSTAQPHTAQQASRSNSSRTTCLQHAPQTDPSPTPRTPPPPKVRRADGPQPGDEAARGAALALAQGPAAAGAGQGLQLDVGFGAGGQPVWRAMAATMRRAKGVGHGRGMRGLEMRAGVFWRLYSGGLTRTWKAGSLRMPSKSVFFWASCR